MRKTIALALFLATAAIAAHAQTTPPVAQGGDQKPSLAEIKFEHMEHDYGTIKNGANGIYEFKFTNTGKEPLLITEARGSCGCTVPEWPKEPIKPGASSAIKVSYDTKRTGAFTKTVTVTTNTKTPSTVLTIKGIVLEPVKEETMPIRKADDGATPFANPTR